MEGGETGFDEIDDEGSHVIVGVQDHRHTILSQILADPSMVRFDQFAIHGRRDERCRPIPQIIRELRAVELNTACLQTVIQIAHELGVGRHHVYDPIGLGRHGNQHVLQADFVPRRMKGFVHGLSDITARFAHWHRSDPLRVRSGIRCSESLSNTCPTISVGDGEFQLVRSPVDALSDLLARGTIGVDIDTVAISFFDRA